METIRKAYRPWFQKKKIRTEKYKGISPKTGKVTNYVKDVFENTTNKREYIRWFLEGKPGSLTERRTALIRRIARRKAKIATDNYIESNSTDLNKVVDAKLRKLSRAVENMQTEQKSFDNVKFSQTKQFVENVVLETDKLYSTGKFVALHTATDSSSTFTGTAMNAVFGGIEGTGLALSGSITSVDGSAPTAGQLLIGHGGNNDFAAGTLTAGEGIDITNGNGSITIVGEEASTTNKGVASFASANFTVSSGAVTITAIDGGTF